MRGPLLSNGLLLQLLLLGWCSSSGVVVFTCTLLAWTSFSLLLGALWLGFVLDLVGRGGFIFSLWLLTIGTLAMKLHFLRGTYPFRSRSDRSRSERSRLPPFRRPPPRFCPLPPRPPLPRLPPNPFLRSWSRRLFQSSLSPL